MMLQKLINLAMKKRYVSTNSTNFMLNGPYAKNSGLGGGHQNP